MNNEFLARPPVSLFSAATQEYTGRNTIYPGDLRRPWQSVYGFALIAAQLAAGQKLILHCREDEIFEYLATLNHLLKCPPALSRAYCRLKALEAETLARLACLSALETQPQHPTFVDPASALPGSTTHTGAECPDNTADRLTETIARLTQMLLRHRVFLAALAEVKDTGFHAIVIDRRRQPSRPGLEARRYEPILLNGKPTPLPAGFLFPAAHHLTLWGYLVARSEGQSTVWN